MCSFVPSNNWCTIGTLVVNSIKSSNWRLIYIDNFHLQVCLRHLDQYIESKNKLCKYTWCIGLDTRCKNSFEKNYKSIQKTMTCICSILKEDGAPSSYHFVTNSIFEDFILRWCLTMKLIKGIIDCKSMYECLLSTLHTSFCNTSLDLSTSI